MFIDIYIYIHTYIYVDYIYTGPALAKDVTQKTQNAKDAKFS